MTENEFIEYLRQKYSMVGEPPKLKQSYDADGGVLIINVNIKTKTMICVNNLKKATLQCVDYDEMKYNLESITKDSRIRVSKKMHKSPHDILFKLRIGCVVIAILAILFKLYVMFYG